jgi:hypothetical protein
MKIFDTIRHIPYIDSSGIIESVQPLEKCSVQTSLGNLVPIYEIDDHGRKKLTPVKFHKNGSVKSISLQNPLSIDTSIGKISAELITFYPGGELRRIFPLNGKLSGYWSEENEYKLAESIKVPTSVGNLQVKPINIQFYETGELKSMTLWPGERINIKTEQGSWSIKSGISFHKNGNLATCEPVTPVPVKTPIGMIEAFDPDPNGLCGEVNSLSFSETGEVLGCSSIQSVVNAVDSLGSQYKFQPRIVRSYCNDDEYIVQPLKIEFLQEHMVFKNGFTTCGKLSSSSTYQIEPFMTEKTVTSPMTCH